jgi:predicted HNH restriction endonuclease
MKVLPARNCPADLPESYGALYLKALEVVLPNLSDLSRDVLYGLWAEPNHTTSAGVIAKNLDVAVVNVNHSMAEAGHAVLNQMDLPIAESRQQFQRPWWVLARKGKSSSVRGFPWELRPEVVAALEFLDFENAMTVADDELVAQTSLTEAQPTTVNVQVKRRNSLAREKCLARFTPITCQICGLDFAEMYGPAFQDCIHVHHLNPLALANARRAVNPDVDLIPVCPNCHAVIHAHGEIRSPETVRALIQQPCDKQAGPQQVKIQE